jgi:hypothetical protein
MIQSPFAPAHNLPELFGNIASEENLSSGVSWHKVPLPSSATFCLPLPQRKHYTHAVAQSGENEEHMGGQTAEM